MLRDLTRGVFRENPIFVALLGLCPSLAVTTHVSNGIGLGAAVIVVLVLTSLTVSLLRDVIPLAHRVPAYLAIIAVFVTLVDVFMSSAMAELREALGVFVPLIVVNCLIMGRAEAFARRMAPGRSVLDALGMGVGFLVGLTLISLVREALGSGTITLFAVGGFDGVVELPWLSEQPVRVIGYATGALLVVGYLRALFVWVGSLRGDRPPAPAAVRGAGGATHRAEGSTVAKEEAT